jgi:glycerophosphoryl diester phosphodiesterase
VTESRFSQEGRPAIVAHRGASAIEAENTLPAFEAAIQAGADAVEFDVRMTADDEAVVLHDPDVARTTDGSGLVRHLSLAQVKRLNIRAANGHVTEISTLVEVLDLVSGRAAVDIEIKNVPGEPDFESDRELAVDATLAALDSGGFVGAALLSSFNPLSLAYAKSRAPSVPTGLLTDPSVDAHVALAFAREQGHRWVLPYVDRVRAAGESFPGEAHAVGMRVGVWITDDPVVAAELLRSGVDALATNDPAALISARRQSLGA